MPSGGSRAARGVLVPGQGGRERTPRRTPGRGYRSRHLIGQVRLAVPCELHARWGEHGPETTSLGVPDGATWEKCGIPAASAETRRRRTPEFPCSSWSLPYNAAMPAAVYLGRLNQLLASPGSESYRSVRAAVDRATSCREVADGLTLLEGQPAESRPRRARSSAHSFPRSSRDPRRPRRALGRDDTVVFAWEAAEPDTPISLRVREGDGRSDIVIVSPTAAPSEPQPDPQRPSPSAGPAGEGTAAGSPSQRLQPGLRLSQRGLPDGAAVAPSAWLRRGQRRPGGAARRDGRGPNHALTPRLAVTRSEPVSECIARLSRLATLSAASWSVPCRSIANSSPPSRPTTSVSRAARLRTAASERKARSPEWWPPESLTVLRLSTSATMRLNVVWWRRASLASWSSRSWNAPRLRQPVRASWWPASISWPMRRCRKSDAAAVMTPR